MIIRITINDNDFTERLANISGNLVGKTLRYFEQKNDYKGWREFFNIINPNVTEKPTKEQKEFVIDAVSKTLKDIVKIIERPDAVKYIENNLKVSVVEIYRDRWENGEVLYYFTRPNIILEN